MSGRSMKIAAALAAMVMVLALLVASCGPAPTPERIEVEVTKEVEVTRIVAGTPETVIVTATPEPEEVVVEGPVSGGHLTVGFETTIEDTGDLHKASSWHSFAMAGHMLDCVVDKNPKDGKIYPGLAESWEFSDDGLVLTLHLRDDVTFQDGTVLDAEAVAYNFNRIATEPDAEGKDAYGELGVGEYFDRAEVVDDFTVNLVYKQFYAPLLDMLTLYEVGGIHSPTAIEKYGEDYGSEMVVGTGPFKWVEWTGPNGIFTFERSEDYNWAASFYNHQGPPYLESATYKGILEYSVRSAALESGDVDVATVREREIPRFDGMDGFKTKPIISGGMGYICNLEGLMKDPLLRQALSHAIDRDAIINSPAYAGIGSVNVTFVPDPVWGDTSEFLEYGYLYDPDKAKALLDEAGWTDEDGDGVREAHGVEGVADGTRLTLSDDVLVERQETHEMLQAMAAEVGIELDLQVVEYQTWKSKMGEGDFDIYSGGMMMSTWFGSTIYFDTDGVENYGNYFNPDVDAAYETAYASSDLEVQRDAIRIVQQNVLQDAYYIPLVNKVWPWAMADYVMDAEADSFGIALFLYDTWINPNP